MNNFEREFGWDDEIQQDSEFILLPEGDYVFTVKGFERARHTPQQGGKLPACNKAIVEVTIVANEGEATLKHNLFLHSSTEGMLSAFFGAIGLKKKGEPLKMNWQLIPGKKGVCKVGQREYNGNKFNDIKRMIYAEDVDYTKVLNQNVQPQQAPQTQAQPTYQPQPVQQSFNFNQTPPGFTPVPEGANLPFNQGQ